MPLPSRCRFAGQGMMLTHKPLQTLFQNMGVNLRGRNIGMAQEQLHTAKIRPMGEKVAGKGMTHDMGGNLAAVQPGILGELLKLLGKPLAGQMTGSGA